MRDSSEAGFSLVELLVSLALLAAIAALSVTGLNSVSKMDSVRGRVTRQAEVDAARDTVRRLVTSSRWITEYIGSTGPIAIFDGQTNSLMVVSISDSRLERGGLVQSIIELNGEKQLVLRRRPRGNDSGYELVLLNNVRDARFAYYGQHDDGGKETWRENWQQRAHLPLMVSINLSFPVDDERKWTLLTVDIPTAK